MPSTCTSSSKNRGGAQDEDGSNNAETKDADDAQDSGKVQV